MCCRLFRCCGWCLDIVQRLITFALASILCCAVCCGLIVALGAGIAYGYNISIAEFLDLKQDDITVYVRRGQFGDKPAFKPPFRRSGGDEPDMFPTNFSDYQDNKYNGNTRPLSAAWQKAQETSNYADKLTKYSKIKSNLMRSLPKEEDENASEVMTMGRPTTVVPPFIKAVQFVANDTSDYKLIMRNFQPDYRLVNLENENGDQATKESRRKHRKKKPKLQKPEVKYDVDEDIKSIYLKPNASKFLYRKEDFDDADIETSNKPV